MVYCDECKKRPATVHITQVYNGKKVEMHLCEECAAEKGTHVFKFDGGFSLPKLLGSFFGGGAPLVENVPLGRPRKALSCPVCGMSFDEIGQIGRLGCSECYTAFEKEIEPILRRVHGNNQHLGKIPHRRGSRVRVEKLLEDLKSQLQAAVMREEYEKAAELRDKIKELEKRKDTKQGRG